MAEFRATPADATHLPQIRALLRENNLNGDDIDLSSHYFLIVTDGTSITACAGLELYSTNALLRSVAVSPALQGTGLGGRILTAITEAARSKEITALYLLTTTAEDFFSYFGFSKIDRDSFPAELKRTQQFSAFCPSSAICMKKEITG